MKNLSASSAKIFLAPTTVVLCAALLATPLVNAAQSNVLVLSQNPAALVSAVSIANSNASKKSAPSQASNRLSAPDEEHDSVSNTNTTRPNESTESGLAQLPFNTTVMQVLTVLGLILALAFYLIMLRYRQLVLQLKKRNQLILEQQKDLRLAYEELEKLSRTDELTALPNRRHFNRVLAHEHRRRQRNKGPLSLLLIDIDHFKSINDNYGHPAGDQYLRVVAQTLKTTVNRASDFVARWGGEEFACLLPDTPAAGAYHIARKIQDAVSNAKRPSSLIGAPQLTLSIGIATLSGESSIGVQQLLSEADTQLYAAKNAGRNHIMSREIN